MTSLHFPKSLWEDPHFSIFSQSIVKKTLGEGHLVFLCFFESTKVKWWLWLYCWTLYNEGCHKKKNWIKPFQSQKLYLPCLCATTHGCQVQWCPARVERMWRPDCKGMGLFEIAGVFNMTIGRIFARRKKETSKRKKKKTSEDSHINRNRIEDVRSKRPPCSWENWL